MKSAKKRSDEEHPSQRFVAPRTITKDVPLKTIMNPDLIGLIAQSFSGVISDFDSRGFRKAAEKHLDSLDFKCRARHIADALRPRLPGNVKELTTAIVDSLGPELMDTERSGLAVFFYFPHSMLIHDHLYGDFSAGMTACYEITKRFTAEFAIRPILDRFPKRAFKLLKRWTKDKNAHVRRLVSEGTRPRLPWAERVEALRGNPEFAMDLLELLKDDPELYVRRSIANHLGDIAKENLKLVLETCERWLGESEDLDDERRKARQWMIRHAIRHPAKKGDKDALRLRKLAGGK